MDGRLSWPSWLTIADSLPTRWSSVRLSHRAPQVMESAPAADRRSNHWAATPLVLRTEVRPTTWRLWQSHNLGDESIVSVGGRSGDSDAHRVVVRRRRVAETTLAQCAVHVYFTDQLTRVEVFAVVHLDCVPKSRSGTVHFVIMLLYYYSLKVVALIW